MIVIFCQVTILSNVNQTSLLLTSEHFTEMPQLRSKICMPIYGRFHRQCISALDTILNREFKPIVLVSEKTETTLKRKTKT